jgi:predicted Zn finger-like uncharacterized protein
MKITCNACQASYNLPDEKVAGRRVKVRCKRCGEPIVVDGAAAPPVAADYEDEATRVMTSPTTMSGAAAMWTVNLSETEQGDMTDEELLAGWQAGIVTEDAYVWREGMDDWKALLDVPELVALLSAHTAPEAPVQAPSAPLQPKPATASTPAAPKPKAPSPTSPGAGLGATPLAAHVIPKPLQAAAQPPRRNDATLFMDKPKPRREKPKEASRNENSVLFSLDALKAAAGGEEHGPVSARINEDLLTMGPGVGGVELLNAPLIDVNVPAPVQQTRSRGPSRAPVPVAGMPDSFPMPKQQSSKGWLWAVIAVVVLGGGGYFAYANGMMPGAAAVPSAVPSAVPAVPAAATTVAAPAAPTASSEPVASSAVEPASDSAPKSGGNTTPVADRGSADRGSADRGAQEPSGDKPPSSGDGDKPPASSGGDKSKEKPEEASGAAFNTEAARAALNGAASQAASCKASDGPTGSGKVQVTFVPSGRVTSANVVGGPFGGTSVGGCIARTFRQARVPAFSGDPQTVSKSFTIP